VALSLMARLTEADKVCAWIDVSNAFDPASAAAVGVDLTKLLWVRCGIRHSRETQPGKWFVLPEKYLVPRSIKRGLHGGGFGPHPRTEVRGMATAVEDLLTPRCTEPQCHQRPLNKVCESNPEVTTRAVRASRRAKDYDAIDQGIRSADLVLQTGGFSAVVLDMGNIAPEVVSRIELATWQRYRLAAERTQSSILLLTQYPCAKSSSELQLRFSSAIEAGGEKTVFTGMQLHVEVPRRRFAQTENNVIPLRKPPQNERMASLCFATTWVVSR
jgi:recombination protein RecA